VLCDEWVLRMALAIVDKPRLFARCFLIYSLAMRTLSSAFLSAVLCLATPNTGLTQQSPANSDNSSDGADMANSPCWANQDADKVVHVKQSTTKGLLIHKVNPSYPEAARNAYIEGTVMLCASISKEGRIVNLTAASGPPELIPSFPSRP
jgi:hypothetical protein